VTKQKKGKKKKQNKKNIIGTRHLRTKSQGGWGEQNPPSPLTVAKKMKLKTGKGTLYNYQPNLKPKHGREGLSRAFCGRCQKASNVSGPIEFINLLGTHKTKYTMKRVWGKNS